MYALYIWLDGYFFMFIDLRLTANCINLRLENNNKYRVARIENRSANMLNLTIKSKSNEYKNIYIDTAQ